MVRALGTIVCNKSRSFRNSRMTRSTPTFHHPSCRNPRSRHSRSGPAVDFPSHLFRLSRETGILSDGYPREWIPRGPYGRGAKTDGLDSIFGGGGRMGC